MVVEYSDGGCNPKAIFRLYFKPEELKLVGESLTSLSGKFAKVNHEPEYSQAICDKLVEILTKLKEAKKA